MKNKSLHLVIISLILLLSQSCRKDNFEKIGGWDPDVVNFVETTVKGIVKDEDGNAVFGALVTLGTSQEETDANGIFSITGLANERNGFLRIKKQGYFNAFPAFNATKESFAQVNVTLISNATSQVVSGASGGTVNIGQGAQVIFQERSFEKNGIPFLTDIAVRSTYLDPTREDINEVMPGNLYAINAEGEERILQSFGMVKVELSDASGESPDLVKNVTLKIPVPSSLQGVAPTNIPLWYFDEEKGHWVEEGEAILEGDVYVGEVSHFTWWNCDMPFDLVMLDGKLTYQGMPLRGIVCISNVSTGDKRCIYSNMNGTFSGKVPKDIDLEISVEDCDGNDIYNYDLGMLSTNTTHNIEMPVLSNSTSLVRVSGSVDYCDVEDSDAYVIFNFFRANGLSTSNTVFTNESGQFNELLSLDCSPTSYYDVKSTAYRLTTQFYTNFCTKTHSITNNEIEGGKYETCGQGEPSLVTYAINGYDNLVYEGAAHYTDITKTDGKVGIILWNLDLDPEEQRGVITVFNTNTPTKLDYTIEGQNGALKKWEVVERGSYNLIEYSGPCNRMILEITDVVFKDLLNDKLYPASSIYIDAYLSQF